MKKTEIENKCENSKKMSKKFKKNYFVTETKRKKFQASFNSNVNF